MRAQTARIGVADDADKLFEGVGIGRRLAVVVSFPQPIRRLTSSAQPLEHALAPPPSAQCHGAAGRNANLAAAQRRRRGREAGWARRLGGRAEREAGEAAAKRGRAQDAQGDERDLKARLALPCLTAPARPNVSPMVRISISQADLLHLKSPTH
jgi:hypothetical protein